MTLFFLIASLLVIASLSILLPLITGQRVGSELDHQDANIAIARERQSTLQRAFDSGEMDADTFRSEIDSLEEALAADLASGQQTQRDTRGQWFAIAAVVLLVPVSAGVLYMQLGTPEAMDARYIADVTQQAQNQATAQAAAEAGGEQQQAAIEELIPQLEQRLADVPDDIEGWRLLGRTRLMTGAFDAARTALAKANELAPDHPDTLASLAEATAMADGGGLAGEPVALLDHALTIDPQHPQSRWLLAIARQQAGDHQVAIELFEGLMSDFDGDPQATGSVQQMIDRSRQALAGAELDGQMPPASAGSDGAAPTTPDNSASDDDAGEDATPDNLANQTGAGNGDTGSSTARPGEQNPADRQAAVTARVSLELPDDVTLDPQQSVFIYARAIDGPPMPLAAVRLTVADLPVELTLDDTAALVPGMSIGNFDEVTIGARVSLNDDAIAQPGDWLGEVTPVATREAEPVSVTIDRRITE